MHVIGSHDGYKIHPLTQGKLRLHPNHLFIGTVATVGREKKIGTTGFRSLGIRRKSAANQIDLLIHRSRYPMDRSDKGTSTTPNHSATDFPAHKKI